jgi:thiol-disulfide isomerase/thioredoxin
MKTLALVALLVVAPLAAAGDLQLLKPGDAAPVLKDVNWVQGDAVAAWEPGHVYVIDFWATWCGPCRRSIPDLDALSDKHAGSKVHVIGAAIWPRSNMVPTADFVKEKGEAMSYGIAEDIEGKTAETFMSAAAQNGIPTCMVVDQAGKVAWIGNPLNDTFESTVEKVVAGTWDTAAFAKEFVPTQERDFKSISIQKGMGEAKKKQDWAKLADLAGQLYELDPEQYMQAALIKYDALVRAEKPADASTYARGFVDGAFKENAQALNGLAWTIVDPAAAHAKPDLELAYLAADRANTLTGDKDFSVLDTLARVVFLKGDVAKALTLQQKAIDNAPEEAKAELKVRLEEYQTAQHG